MKLCASRAFWLVAYPSQGHEMLFDAHTRCFAALGGVPRRGIYDNMKTAVDKVAEGQGARRQRALRRDVRALPVRRRLLQRRLGLGEGRRGEERAGQPPAHLDRGGASARFGTLRRTQRLAGRALPRAVGRGPPSRARAVQRGRDAGARAAAPDADARRRSTATWRSPRGCRAPAWCRWRATATRCRASWPGRWSARGCIPTACDGRRRRRAWSPTTSALCDREPDALRLAALHPAGAAQARRACATARRSPTCPSRCSSCAARCCAQTGGDRVMAQVLAVVPAAGLDAVLVAVELALESAPPGRVSVEHVLNVLARLNAAPRADNGRDGTAGARAAAGRHRRATTALRTQDARRPTMRDVDRRTQGAAPARHGRRLGRSGRARQQRRAGVLALADRAPAAGRGDRPRACAR